MKSNEVIIGYKFVDKNMKPQHGDITYKVGKTYKIDGHIEPCKNGFHFSKTIKDAIQLSKGCRLLKVSIPVNKYYKEYSHFYANGVCTSVITIDEELPTKKIFKEFMKDKNWNVVCSTIKSMRML